MVRHKHHFKIAFALAIAAGSWGVYWLPQRILEDGGLTGGWGTISQMMIGIVLLTPFSLWRKFNGRTSGFSGTHRTAHATAQAAVQGEGTGSPIPGAQYTAVPSGGSLGIDIPGVFHD